VALTKRDVFFFLERLCEQTNSFVKYQYKKQFGIFRNFKIRRGNIKLTSYVLQSLISPTEISRIVEVYSSIGHVLCNYSIEPLPCLYTAYDLKRLNVYTKHLENVIAQDLIKSITVLNIQSKDLENAIAQDLIKSITVLNTQLKVNEESIQCLVNYTITKQ
jgi:hypothetical protein